MDIFTTVLLPALTGVVIGVVSGMFGIGGGTVMVPIFRLVFGMTAIASTATSLFAIIPTSISGATTHLRNKTCVLQLGLTAGLGGACTSAFGVWLATISPSWLVMLAAAIIIGVSAANMLRKAYAMKPVAKTEPASLVSAESASDAASASPAEQSSDQSSDQPAAEDSTQSSASSSVAHSETYGFSLTPKNIAIGALIGMAAGVASGYVGVGGGFLMVPLMVSVFGLPMKRASGTSLIAVMILAVPGVIEQGILGNINYLAGLILAAGSIPGAILGANLIRYVPERALRAAFGVFLIFAAILLVLNETAVFL